MNFKGMCYDGIVANEEGFPLRGMGVLDAPHQSGVAHTLPGKVCPECHKPTMIHRDGCDFCTACGYVGQCG